MRLNIFADTKQELQATDEQLDKHRRVVGESIALFGSRHFREYDFLLAISDHFTGIGLEHHESSENGVGLGYFTDWDSNGNGRDLLAHEMTHSWNGKFRRPADLWTPSYEVPMGPSLLWVYEGMTEYLGVVLTEPLWPVVARTYARHPCHPCRELRPRPRRPEVAQPAGHHAATDRQLPGPAELRQLATRQGLLHREYLRLAGRRHEDP